MRHPTALQRGNQSDLLGAYRPVADRQNLSAQRIQGVGYGKSEGIHQYQIQLDAGRKAETADDNSGHQISIYSTARTTISQHERIHAEAKDCCG